MKTSTAQAAYIDSATEISGLVSCLQVYADRLHRLHHCRHRASAGLW